MTEIKPKTTRRAKSNASGAATIYDIAELAGVNPSTVSRALTTPGRINAKTEAKVRAAAAELNYKVNPFARALPTGRTRLIAFMISDITNPVFFKAIRGAETTAAQAGYTMVVAESQESPEEEAKVLERIQPMVDGIVLVTTRLTDAQIQAANRSKPVVLVNRVVPGVPDVVPNNEPGIIEAVRHLAELGHRHLAFLSGPVNSWINTDRWNLLMKAALAAGMTIVEIGNNEPTLDSGFAAIDKVLASGVSAVVTYNDLMAIGLLKAARERGLEIPGALSVIGFDNIFGSDFTNPPLSTIQLPLESTGADAVQAVLTLLEAENRDDALVAESAIKTSLLIRNSTGPVNK
ncbi:MAG: LacI family DNA-binding transcriptional regulator [Micrococcales bacterium]